MQSRYDIAAPGLNYYIITKTRVIPHLLRVCSFLLHFEELGLVLRIAPS